jgi:helicase
MRIQELDLEPALVDRLDELGFDELWPPQAEAAPHAVAGENLVLAVPTASGKTLVAYMALLNHALRGGKALYLVPLRALAREKYEELQQFEELGLDVALATGDLDSADPHLRDVDVIVATSEKADALMRHRAHWLERMGVVVADEVHLVDDPGRGPTLEVTLSRFRQLNPEAQVVALSATIPNSREIAAWLDAEHVKSDWRPVTLRQAVLFGRALHYEDGEKAEVPSELLPDRPVGGLVDDTLGDDGQAITFVNTRKSTESVARDLSSVTSTYLSGEERARLRDAANQLRSGPETTEVEENLARAVASGSAFHHAGLPNDARTLVEERFREGDLKAVAATPTLAAGINLPARRVIVRDLWRYDPNEGQVPLPVMEYKQMSGRAGRPDYDDVGEALTIAKNRDKLEEIMEGYLEAPPEEVDSKLGAEPALRRHILGSVASGFVDDEESLRDFVRSTFFAQQSEVSRIESRITRVLDFLLEEELLVAEGDAFSATSFGHRVSELYIDPVSGVTLRDAAQLAGEALSGVDVTLDLGTGRGTVEDPDVTAFSFLHAVASTTDMDLLYTRRGEEWLEAAAHDREDELLVEPPDGGWDVYLSEIKTASLLEDWIDETPEEQLVETYNTYPGDIHRRAERARWLLYAMDEIGALFDADIGEEVGPLRTRVTHGAKEELLPLLEFRGVGRARARNLWEAGFRGREDLRGVPVDKLARVPGIGPKIAARIKEALGEEVDDDAVDDTVAGQQTLAHFQEGDE